MPHQVFYYICFLEDRHDTLLTYVGYHKKRNPYNNNNILYFIWWFTISFSEFIGAEAAKIGLELPDTIPNLRSWLQSLKLAAYQKNDNSVEKGKNWGIFDFCNQFLQTEDQLSTATLDLAQRLADKNVIYSEIRFCPSLHTQKDLNAEQALQAVIKGKL